MTRVRRIAEPGAQPAAVGQRFGPREQTDAAPRAGRVFGRRPAKRQRPRSAAVFRQPAQTQLIINRSLGPGCWWAPFSPLVMQRWCSILEAKLSILIQYPRSEATCVRLVSRDICCVGASCKRWTRLVYGRSAGAVTFEPNGPHCVGRRLPAAAPISTGGRRNRRA